MPTKGAPYTLITGREPVPKQPFANPGSAAVPRAQGLDVPAALPYMERTNARGQWDSPRRHEGRDRVAPPDSLGRTAKRTNGKAEPRSRAQGQDGCGPALTGHSPGAPGAWAGSGAQRGLTPASATRLEMAEAALLRQVPGRTPPAGMPTHFTWMRSSKKKQLWKRNHGPWGKRHALNIVTLMKTSH